MKTIIRSILMLVVAAVVSCALALSEARAIGGPCEQLASLVGEEERLREAIDRVRLQHYNALVLYYDAVDEYERRLMEFQDDLDIGWESPVRWKKEARRLRTMGDVRTALKYELAARELQPLWDEMLERRQRKDDLWREFETLRDSLRAIVERRSSLMEECGLVREMSDPMASFEHRVPRIADPSPETGDAQIAQPENTDSRAQSPEKDQAVRQFGPRTAPSNLMFPGLSEASSLQGSAAADPAAGEAQSTPSVTAETMQVQQPETTSAGENAFGYTHMQQPPAGEVATSAARGQTMKVEQPGSTNTGTSSFGYTHMPLPHNAGQSGTSVAPPPKSLRLFTPVRRMHISPGRSIKR